MGRRGRVGLFGLPLLIAAAMSAAACGSSEITTTPASSGAASDGDRCPSPDFSHAPSSTIEGVGLVLSEPGHIQLK